MILAILVGIGSYIAGLDNSSKLSPQNQIAQTRKGQLYCFLARFQVCSVMSWPLNKILEFLGDAISDLTGKPKNLTAKQAFNKLFERDYFVQLDDDVTPERYRSH